jgi:hypothetical protein
MFNSSMQKVENYSNVRLLSSLNRTFVGFTGVGKLAAGENALRVLEFHSGNSQKAQNKITGEGTNWR